jgi:dATP/dGTP diphosphohydrolase, N-terminal
VAFADGEDLDPETGMSHIAHLRCCTGFLLERRDDRGVGHSVSAFVVFSTIRT